jgi:hypothetical protein
MDRGEGGEEGRDVLVDERGPGPFGLADARSEVVLDVRRVDLRELGDEGDLREREDEGVRIYLDIVVLLVLSREREAPKLGFL